MPGFSKPIEWNSATFILINHLSTTANISDGRLLQFREKKRQIFPFRSKFDSGFWLRFLNGWSGSKQSECMRNFKRKREKLKQFRKWIPVWIISCKICQRKKLPGYFWFFNYEFKIVVFFGDFCEREKSFGFVWKFSATLFQKTYQPWTSGTFQEFVTTVSLKNVYFVTILDPICAKKCFDLEAFWYWFKVMCPVIIFNLFFAQTLYEKQETARIIAKVEFMLWALNYSFFPFCFDFSLQHSILLPLRVRQKTLCSRFHTFSKITHRHIIIYVEREKERVSKRLELRKEKRSKVC